MKVYWKDIEEFNSPWAGMAVNVETKNLIKPKFYLQTGENGRIKLVNGDTVIFQATIVKDYYGVWLVKSFLKEKVSDIPINPISLLDIESRKNLNNNDWLKSWTRFFIDQLSINKTSFLYDGLWLFGVVSKERKSSWQYKPVRKSRYIDNFGINGIKEGINNVEVEWIDWGINGSQVGWAPPTTS